MVVSMHSWFLKQNAREAEIKSYPFHEQKQGNTTKTKKSFGWAVDYLSLLAFSCGEQIQNQPMQYDAHYVLLLMFFYLLQDHSNII
jgi:hypothetical protein